MAKTKKTDVDSRARGQWRERVPMIAERVRLGLGLEPACAIEGVSVRTVEDAIARGDEATLPIIAARAECEAELVADLREHSRNGKPHGATAYLLERIAPKRWRQSNRVEVSGPDGGPQRVEQIALTLAEAIEAARGRDDDDGEG